MESLSLRNDFRIALYLSLLCDFTVVAPNVYGVRIEPVTEGPPRPELPLPPPTSSPCTLKKTREDGDQNGGMSEHTILVENRSNRTWRLERSIMEAVIGNILLATEVNIEDGTCYVRQFAVKRMPKGIINEMRERMLENPLNEIAALGIVSYPGHPNVLQLEAALDDDENVYRLMPFVGGWNMSDWVERVHCSPGGERTAMMKPLFRQLMKGIAYIHSKGICHADISLENVLIDWRAQRLSIIGFGMSFLMPINGDNMRYMSVPDGRKAKASYCSPETFKQKPYDGVKVDVFAAGSVFFIMLTGIPPFAMASRADRRFKKLVYEGDVEGVISQLRVPPIGDQAVDLLKKMMAYRAEDRPLPEQVLQHPWMTP